MDKYYRVVGVDPIEKKIEDFVEAFDYKKAFSTVIGPVPMKRPELVCKESTGLTPEEECIHHEFRW